MKKIYLLSCMLVFTFTVSAVTRTWVGGATGTWGSNSWSPAGTPRNGDDVVINGATVTMDIGGLVKSITLGTNAQLTISNQVGLSLSGQTSDKPAITLSSGAQLNIYGTLNIGIGTFDNIGTGINATGASILVDNNATVSINKCITGIFLDQSSTLTSNNQISIDNCTTGISLAQKCLFSNGGSLLIGQVATIAGQGILLDAGSSLQNAAYSTIRIDNVQGPGISTTATNGSRSINNSGTIYIGSIGNITGAGISVIQTDITSSGSIYIDGTADGMQLTQGSLTISSSTSNGIFAGTNTKIAGSAIVASNTTITNNGLMILKNTQVDGLRLSGGNFTNNYWIRIGHYPPNGSNPGSGDCHGIGIHTDANAVIANNNTIDFGIVDSNAIQLGNASQLTNAGSINGGFPYALGMNTVISGHMMVLDGSTFTNTAAGTYNAYTSAYNITDTGFYLNHSGRVQNSGTINILGPMVAISLDNSSDFLNYGSLQTSFGLKRVLYIAGGSTFQNFQGGSATLSGIGFNKNTSIAYITGGGSKITNSGALTVNTASGQSSNGIELAQSALLQNNATGIVNLSNIQGNGIEVTNGQITNAGTISIDSIIGVSLHLHGGGNSSANNGIITLGSNTTVNSGTGILLEDAGTVLNNNATGQIFINRIAAKGIQVSTGGLFENFGYITWGTATTAFAGTAALNVSYGGIFHNRRGATSILEFVSCTGDAITMDNASASSLTFSSSGATVKFGNITGRGIFRYDSTYASYGVYQGDPNSLLTNNGVFMTMPGGKMNLLAQINNTSIGALNNNDGTVTMAYAFSNSGTITNGTVAVHGGTTTNNAAFTNASGGQISNNGIWNMTGTFNNNSGGVCKGSGIFQGSVFNNAGTVAPGNSPGCLAMANGYVNQSTSLLDMEVNGKTTACTDFDRLNVTGSATIAGSSLRVTLGGGYTGTAGDQITILKSTSLIGTFSNITLPAGWGVFYNTPSAGDVTLAYLTTLPLTVLDFTVIKTGEKATVSWTTAHEVNTDHFELERSNGNQYRPIATIAAINTAGDHPYEFTDPFPLAGRNDYRLKMVDIDGKYTYSRVASVTFDNGQAVIGAMYPNPVMDILNISVAKTTDDLSVEVISQDGKTILTKLLPVRGVYQLNLSALAAGIYFIKTNHGEAYKLVKQ